MTQEALAAAVGIGSKQEISAIECGRAFLPSRHLAAFAEALRVPERTFGRVVLSCHDDAMARALFGTTAPAPVADP